MVLSCKDGLHFLIEQFHLRGKFTEFSPYTSPITSITNCVSIELAFIRLNGIMFTEYYRPYKNLADKTSVAAS